LESDSDSADSVGNLAAPLAPKIRGVGPTLHFGGKGRPQRSADGTVGEGVRLSVVTTS